MAGLVGILGIVFLLGFSYLISNNKKEINYRGIVAMLIVQVAIVLIMFKTSIGIKVIESISNFFTKIIMFGNEGVDFVLGGLKIEEGATVFFINVLLLTIFTSTLLSVLNYLKILPYIIKFVGGVISKITGVPKVLSFNAANSIFLGQSESLLAVKSHLTKMDNNRLFIISTSAMGSVSASICGAYMQLIEPKYVLVAMVLNMFSGLIIGSIVAPVKKDENEVDEINVEEFSNEKSIFEAIGNGAIDGGKVALIVASMLIAFIGLIAMINYGFISLFGTSLQTVLGYILYPIAWLIGVPGVDAVEAGSIIGTKLVTNEFVAMLDFTSILDTLQPKTIAIVSTALISFANFSSIGIIAGSMQAISDEKAKVVSKFGLKLLLIATISSLLTAAIVGIFA